MNQAMERIAAWVYEAQAGTEPVFRFDGACLREDAPPAAVQAFEAWKQELAGREKSGKRYVFLYDKPFGERTLEEQVCFSLHAYGAVPARMLLLLQRERAEGKAGGSRALEAYWDELEKSEP